MIILITSDIHSNLNSLDKLIAKHPKVDYHLDAGDSQLSLETLKKHKIISVKGNTDSEFSLPLQRVLNINNQKILLIHGHTMGVKSSIINLTQTAKKLNVNFVIFGHTHLPFNKTIDDIVYLNPGSLGYDSTYIVIENNKVRFHSIWLKK